MLLMEKFPWLGNRCTPKLHKYWYLGVLKLQSLGTLGSPRPTRRVQRELQTRTWHPLNDRVVQDGGSLGLADQALADQQANEPLNRGMVGSL